MFAIALTLVVLSSGWSLTRSLRRRQLSIDVIALIAMVGALALDEYLAAAVIAVMLAGGNALEAAATGRAKRELTALVARAPRTAHRRCGDRVEEVAVGALAIGDIVLVRSGEVVPVDGVVVAGEALVDEASLTGEALPVFYARGAHVRSGVSNAGPPFELEAESAAADSAYAALVRLVERAQGAACAVRSPGRPLRGDLPARHPARRGRSPGCSAATRFAPWPCSSSPRRAR